MGSKDRRHQKLFLDNYKAILSILSKTLIIFCMSSIAVISVLNGDTQLDTENTKVRAVARWRRSEILAAIAASNEQLPFTEFHNSSSKFGKAFWQSIQPRFQCPETLLRKVGDVGDAGKWMCGMQILGKFAQKQGEPSPCSVYSTGSKENSFFEVELIGLTNCTIYAYEPSAAIMDHPLRYFEDRVHLESVLIGGTNQGHTRTLKTLMEKNGGQQWVDVVKLNIVGQEGDSDIQTLEKILDDFQEQDNLPIGQLLVRLSVKDWDVAGAARGSSRVGNRIVAVFQDLEIKGLRMFHKEVSPYFKDVDVADFSFVNTQALDKFLEAKDLKKYTKK